MISPAPHFDAAALDAFVGLVGDAAWRHRLSVLRPAAQAQTRLGRAALQRHAIELAIERLRRGMNRPPSLAERWIAQYATAAATLEQTLPAAGRSRLVTLLRAGLCDDECLVPAFHLLRTAGMQDARGFDVGYAGLIDAAPFDLLITREGAEAEVACDVLSAEEGRGVRRGAWFDLVDRVDPDLQTWLAAHPGRYILKLTLPRGLRDAADPDGRGLLGILHDRIRAMLA